jgi:hypothetical protein
MRVLHADLLAYPEDPVRFFELERYEGEGADYLLVPGRVDFSVLDALGEERIVYVELEEPNRFFVDDPLFRHDGWEPRFERVLTLCPFTARWLNARQGVAKRTPVFFPFNRRYEPAHAEKRFDVIYTGHILSPPIERMAQAISRFDYRIVSGSDHPLVTHHATSYVEKLDLLARARVSVVANLLYLGDPHVESVRRLDGWEQNAAFSQLDPAGATSAGGFPVAPQLKSRVFEAAFAKTLILCERDPFGVIERYFEPDREFVYFDRDELEPALERVLSDPDRFAPVVERAYERAVSEYTTDRFFERYLSDPFATASSLGRLAA